MWRPLSRLCLRTFTTSTTPCSAKVLREAFKPLSPNEGGTDWYDQGRSIVDTIVPMFDDNYAFVITVNYTTRVVVDPAEPLVVKKVLDRLHTEVPKGLEAVLTTHKHDDHTSGNFAFSQMYGGAVAGGLLHKATGAPSSTQESVIGYKLKVYGPANDGPIPSMTHPVKQGDVFHLGATLMINPNETYQNTGAIKVKVINTPFHTSGHISYLLEKVGAPPALFCGDTLFVGGCGRFFEGNGHDMVKTFNKFKKLKKNTEVYCGHEYTIDNLKFALSVDPENVDLIEKYEWAVKRTAEGQPTIPTTIGDELKYNPFLRCDTDVIRNAVNAKKTDTEGDVADKLRDMKNMFKG